MFLRLAPGKTVDMYMCLATCAIMITLQRNVTGQMTDKWSRFVKSGHGHDIDSQYSSLLETNYNLSLLECARATTRNPQQLWFVYNSELKACFISSCWGIPTEGKIDSNSVLYRKQGASAKKSCSEVVAESPGAEDGEYWLHPDAPTFLGCPTRIYCHNMTTSTPSEYVSLLTTNTGVYPNKYNKLCLGEKNFLVGSGEGNSGTTNFNKIGIQISTMKVRTDDYTFATVSGTRHPYAHGADCYNQANYPQCGPIGTFHINTEGTGLVIREQQTWSAYGYQPFAPKVTRSPDGREISLLCGGFCGGCSPDGGLQLHRDPQGAHSP